MRENWNLSAPDLNLSLIQLTGLIQPAFDGDTVLQATPAVGGLANANLRLTLARHPRPILARFWVRSAGDAAKEVGLIEHVAGRIPTPRVFLFAESNPINGHPYALMEWFEGDRLEVAVKTASSEQIAGISRSVGATLARIHQIIFPSTGEIGPDLKVTNSFPVDGTALTGFVRHCLSHEPEAARLGPELGAALLFFVETEHHLLDTWEGPPCLSHADFGGSNILIHGAEVAAVLDWEFAIAGAPFFDLGNLLRPPVGEIPGFADGVAAGYRESGGSLPEHWRRMSQIADLFAWLQFLGRSNASEALIRDAHSTIGRTIGF